MTSWFVMDADSEPQLCCVLAAAAEDGVDVADDGTAGVDGDDCTRPAVVANSTDAALAGVPNAGDGMRMVEVTTGGVAANARGNDSGVLELTLLMSTLIVAGVSVATVFDDVDVAVSTDKDNGGASIAVAVAAAAAAVVQSCPSMLHRTRFSQFA